MQGCSIRCRGCISADTWAHDRGRTRVSDVLDGHRSPGSSTADGFTISGGEPFDQAPALAELLAGLRPMSKADILVFTGYPLEAIEPRLVVDGRAHRRIDHGPVRRYGAANACAAGQRQSEALQADRSRPNLFAAYDRRIAGGDRSFDVMFDEQGEIWLAGIPGRDDFRRLKNILRANGGEAISSQDGRSSRYAGEVPE